MNTPENLIIHHTLSTASAGKKQIDGVNNYHKSQGYPMSSLGYYVGYHYFIEEDGSVIQCRLDTDAGAHTSQQSMNTKSLGICLAGNFDSQLPTELQKKALLRLIVQKRQEYNIPVTKIFPHRHFATYKSCWGSKLPDDIWTYLQPQTPGNPVSPWAKEAVARAKARGITDWRNPQEFVGTATLEDMLRKLGIITQDTNAGISKERMAVILHQLKLL